MENIKIIEHKFFDKEYDCYPMPCGYNSSLENSDKIILPQSALEHLSHYNVTNPMTFKLTNRALNKVIYCGILEFTAKQYTMYIPEWMMDSLSTEPDQRVEVMNVTLPLATYVKIRPLDPIFNTLSNPRIILEYHLQNHMTLYKDEIFSIKYYNRNFKFQIVEIQPTNAVLINNVDVNIDIDTN